MRDSRLFVTTERVRLPCLIRSPFRLFCGRSVSEERTGENPYDLLYQYDVGGNRTLKLDDLSHQQVEYHYDVEPGASPAIYGSRANRLMWFETWNTNFTPPQLLSTTYYVYEYDSTDDARTGRTDGNPARIITEYPAASGQEESAMGEGQSSTLSTEGDGQSAASSSPIEDGGGESMLGPGGGGGCGTGKRYTAIRLGYAVNGRTVTYAHDEEWCWDGAQACPTNYTRTWAREFRYDGARARYMNRPLNPTTLAPSLTKPTAWTDYDGDETYRDYTVSGGVPTPTDAHQPGLWRNLGGVSAYLHSDRLGTLRNTSDLGADPGTARVFTAFGERIGGAADRFGYVGAFGYQSHPEEPGLPFLHVGARYYDTATGRFLQRDPIGISGGLNVHEYVQSSATRAVDPNGQFLWFPIVVGVILFIDALAEPAEAPSPDDTSADFERRRREQRDESLLNVGAEFIPWSMLCRGAKSGLNNIGPSPNPPPFESPFPPMPKGPFIGGGQPYDPSPIY